MLGQKQTNKKNTPQISIQIYYPTSSVLRGRSMCALEHFNPWTTFKLKTNQKMPVSKEPFHSLKSDSKERPQIPGWTVNLKNEENDSPHRISRSRYPPHLYLWVYGFLFRKFPWHLLVCVLNSIPYSGRHSLTRTHAWKLQRIWYSLSKRNTSYQAASWITLYEDSFSLLTRRRLFSSSPAVFHKRHLSTELALKPTVHLLLVVINKRIASAASKLYVSSLIYIELTLSKYAVIC